MTELGSHNTLQPEQSQSSRMNLRSVGTQHRPVFALPQPSSIIKDFLTVPGIAGIALIDGSTIPRLYAADPHLQIHHPNLFLASVTPILRSLAPEIQQIEFLFATYRLYVYRLSYGFTVAVLTHQTVQWNNSAAADLEPFCQTVQAHLNLSIPLLEDWASVRPDENTAVTLQDYLTAFNHLTSIAAQYLGSTLIASQLKRSRPPLADLIPIEINRKGQLIAAPDSTSGSSPSSTHVLTPHQLAALRQWSRTFLNHCSKIIRDFDTTARQAGLTSEEVALLLKQ